MPSLQTYDLVDTLTQGTTLTMAFPSFALEVINASRVVADLVREDAMRRAEALRQVP